MVENSWGPASGYQGHLIMTDEWFDEYMYQIVVNKKYLPDSYIAEYDSEPIMLEPWIQWDHLHFNLSFGNK